MREGESMRRILQDLSEAKAVMVQDGHDIFGFDLGQPIGEVLPAARERLQQVAADSRAYGYKPARGLLTLQEAICSRVSNRYRLPTQIEPKKHVLVSKGSKPIFPSWARTQLKHGESAIVPDKGYAIHYDSVIKAYGKPVTYQCGPGINLLTAIEDACKREPTAKYILVNAPHNPTAITVDNKFYPGVLAIAKSFGMKVIVDLAYEDLILSGAPAQSMLEVEGAIDWGVVETRSMTKGHNIAGVGLTIGTEELIEQLATDLTDDGYGVFAPLQLAAEVALRDEEAVARNCDLYRGLDAILTDGLNSIGWTAKRTKATFYKWMQVPEGCTAEKLCWDLLKHAKVSIWPETGFVNGTQVRRPGEREYVRFSMVETPERTLMAIDELGKFFKENPDLG